MGVVFSIIRLFPSVKQRAQVIELLRSVQDLTRPCPGCMGSWFSEEELLNNHVRYAEQWESEEALHQHIRSDLYKRILAALELSKRPPEVTFYYCSQTKGLEVVEAARRQAKLHESAGSTNGI
ncbi:MAG TPA: antibiotic biosynthesis monooxygenase [Candidatus Limnocylindrales bacterium]|jgi:quinol monooxygenase YgiN|nr:antibiotic biosynthesis monooxygenase [Candidatus Limnocylindrales bacterium]